MLKNNNPFDYFDAIYCINLDRRTDRWETVQREFDKVGIRERVVRFSAIETPENGAIGCLLSHRAIIQKAQDMGWKNVLVFEDDVVFLNAKEILFYAGRIIYTDYDIFYFGGLFSHYRAKIKKYGHYFFQIKQEVYGASSIVYKKDIYELVLTELDKILPGVRLQGKTWDQILGKKIQKEVLCLMPNYPLIQQNALNFSDIEKIVRGDWYGKINLLGFWSLKYKILYPLRFLIFGLRSSCLDFMKKYLNMKVVS